MRRPCDSALRAGSWPPAAVVGLNRAVRGPGSQRAQEIENVLLLVLPQIVEIHDDPVRLGSAATAIAAAREITAETRSTFSRTRVTVTQGVAVRVSIVDAEALCGPPGSGAFSSGTRPSVGAQNVGPKIAQRRRRTYWYTHADRSCVEGWATGADPMEHLAEPLVRRCRCSPPDTDVLTMLLATGITAARRFAAWHYRERSSIRATKEPRG